MKLKTLGILLVVLTSLPSLASATKRMPGTKINLVRKKVVKPKFLKKARTSSGKTTLGMKRRLKDATKQSVEKRKAELQVLRHSVLGSTSKVAKKVTEPTKRIAKQSAKATTRKLDRLEARSPRMTHKVQRGFRAFSPYSATSYALQRASGDKKLLIALGIGQVALFTAVPLSGALGLVALQKVVGVISALPVTPVDGILVFGRQTMKKRQKRPTLSPWKATKLAGREYMNHHRGLQAEHRQSEE